MELSSNAISTASFKIVKKGFDPDEVRSYLSQIATTVEQAQNQSTAMEARARAAVAKLQELSQTQAAPAEGAPGDATPTDASTISKALLLAQRTADTAIAEAKAEADKLAVSSKSQAAAILDDAKVQSARLLEEARVDARRAAEGERVKAEGEVQALLARREFLVSDVEHLEAFLQSQRERLRDTALALSDLVERVPAGLGEIRRPLLSAAGDVPLPLENNSVNIESEPTPVVQSALMPPEADATIPTGMPMSPVDADRGGDSPDDSTTDSGGLKIGGEELR